MGYLEQSTLMGDGVYQRKILMAMTKAAIDIVGEAASGDIADKRHTFGVNILTTPEQYEDRFRRAIAAASLITDANAADGSYDTAVASVYNDLAGVKATDANL